MMDQGSGAGDLWHCVAGLAACSGLGFAGRCLNPLGHSVGMGCRVNGAALAGAMEQEPKSGGRQDKKFDLHMDVASFSPEELMVRQEGRKVTVVGSHKKQSPGKDGGSFWEYQEMHKEMLLPADLDLDAMTCSLCFDAQLHVEATCLALQPAEGKGISSHAQWGEGATQTDPAAKEEEKLGREVESSSQES
ncbi:PREDICTED: heat shock protein 30C-like [Gavialis gangeticus]|uniref:heat shock protein 30C-like n=1 Tax=Gavialis gangeticus TaxID=94835 RepID=UPI00092F4239|nr:PREDICTED: heat shock protein 30C-like [Gavialis gangeticus]